LLVEDALLFSEQQLVVVIERFKIREKTFCFQKE